MVVVLATDAQAGQLTPLGLLNGWTNAPFSTGTAAVTNLAGIVRFKGAIANGTAPTVFTLPSQYRPATNVYVPVTLCNSTKGRLLIQPSGQVSVEAEGLFGNAQCFTSLDGASYALTGAGFTPLALQNGWTNAPFGTSSAAVATVQGVVQFKGAIANGTTNLVSTLPAAFRPTTDVNVVVDLCAAGKGRLRIQPSGSVTVEVEGGVFSKAQCFTSLDGASYALSASGYTALALQNGWVSSPFSTSQARAAVIDNVVHLKGAIANGTTPTPFILPFLFRPAADVFVPADLCGAKKGRLLIQADGVVFIQPFGPLSDAQCFTSLDGVTFAVPLNFTNLTLQNGWTNAPFSTSPAAAATVSGIVHLKGAIANGTSPTAFTLPVAFRPATNVYVPVDLCSARKGRLFIQPTGVVTVETAGPFSDAQCFTSLDGAFYALTGAGFTPLALLSGWTSAPSGTGTAGVTEASGIVYLKGAIANGASALAFTLPAAFRPTTIVYVTVTLCNAAKGRLIIQPSGDVTVQAESAFSNAQCLTSLEGASYALSASGFTALPLVNGWTNAPVATSQARVSFIDGIVHFKGAIANGTAPTAFTLPGAFRPATAVYLPVDLCNATKGRLVISSSGVVEVDAEGPFANAQCFTSLDGASFGI